MAHIQHTVTPQHPETQHNLRHKNHGRTKYRIGSGLHVAYIWWTISLG